MRNTKIILFALAVSAIVIAGSSVSFAYDEAEARDAMIAYAGTDAFSDLLPEERQACMIWVSEGGRMSETCRSAVTRLISIAPDAVTNSQRRALLGAASSKYSRPSPKTAPSSNNGTTVKKDDSTGTIIAAGIVGVIAGMIIHNNWPRDSSPRYRHGPPPPPRYRPAPVRHGPPPPPHGRPPR